MDDTDGGSLAVRVCISFTFMSKSDDFIAKVVRIDLKAERPIHIFSTVSDSQYFFIGYFNTPSAYTATSNLSKS
jgi:hypothetical protein